MVAVASSKLQSPPGGQEIPRFKKPEVLLLCLWNPVTGLYPDKLSISQPTNNNEMLVNQGKGNESLHRYCTYFLM
jgi:hypothetical protein